MISGINHLTFAIKDLKRSFEFYRDVLGMQPLARWAGGAYFLCGETWVCISVDQATRLTPVQDYTHTAFHVTADEFSSMKQKLCGIGVTVWKENSSEGESLYFLDPDGHKFEIHSTTWRERIAATKITPYENMEFFI